VRGGRWLRWSAGRDRCGLEVCRAGGGKVSQTRAGRV